MEHMRIAAGLAHVNYGRISDTVTTALKFSLE